MEIERKNFDMKDVQTNFIIKLLKKFNMSNCKGKKTPMKKGFQHDPGNEIVDVPYRQLIGGLMHLSLTTRPEITYSVSYLSRFLDEPTLETWNAGKRIIRHLQETKNMYLIYTKGNNVTLLTAYSVYYMFQQGWNLYLGPQNL